MVINDIPSPPRKKKKGKTRGISVVANNELF